MVIRCTGLVLPERHPPEGGASSALSPATLRDAGVRPGVPFTLRLEVARKDGEAFAVQRLGFGLYER